MFSMMADFMDLLYGNGMANNIAQIFDTVINALLYMVGGEDGGAADNLLSNAYQALATVAASYLVLTFFIDLAEQLMRDLFSFEKLIVAFIKLMFGCAVILESQTIVRYLVLIGYYFYQLIVTDITTGVVTNLMGDAEDVVSASDYADKLELAFCGSGFFSKLTGMVTTVIQYLQILIFSLVGNLLCIIIQAVAYFQALGVLIKLGLRLFFAPLGCLNIFEGSRSSGVRYFKSVLAEASTLAAMVLILWIVSQINGSSSLLIWGNSDLNLGGYQQFVQTVMDGTDKNEEVIKAVCKYYVSLPVIANQTVIWITAVGCMGSVGNVLRDAFGN